MKVMIAVVTTIITITIFQWDIDSPSFDHMLTGNHSNVYLHKLYLIKITQIIIMHQGVRKAMAASEGTDKDVICQYATYEEFLDSHVTPEDLYYLEVIHSYLILKYIL